MVANSEQGQRKSNNALVKSIHCDSIASARSEPAIQKESQELLEQGGTCELTSSGIPSAKGMCGFRF